MLLVPPVYTNSHSHNLHLTFESVFRLKKAQALGDGGGGIKKWPVNRIAFLVFDIWMLRRLPV